MTSPLAKDIVCELTGTDRTAFLRGYANAHAGVPNPAVLAAAFHAPLTPEQRGWLLGYNEREFLAIAQTSATTQATNQVVTSSWGVLRHVRALPDGQTLSPGAFFTANERVEFVIIFNKN